MANEDGPSGSVEHPYLVSDYGRAIGRALAEQADWNLYLLGTEVRAAQSEWVTAVHVRQQEYCEGVRAAFVAPPVLPGPYHVFFEDADDHLFEQIYQGTYATLEDIQIGENRAVNYSLVVAYDPDEGSLVPVGAIDYGEWVPAALSERLKHAYELAEADVKAEQPDLYARAFPLPPLGQRVHIPNIGNL